MGMRVWRALCTFFVSAATANAVCVWRINPALAQSNAPSSWVGVWQGELDGQPIVILTLAEDNGGLEGTLVLNGISRDGGEPHIVVREVHALMQPHIDEKTLSFELKQVRESTSIKDFKVEFSDRDQRAKIHCLNCGENAPMVEITKQD